MDDHTTKKKTCLDRGTHILEYIIYISIEHVRFWNTYYPPPNSRLGGLEDYFPLKRSSPGTVAAWQMLLEYSWDFWKSVKHWDIILVGGLEHFSLFHTLGIIQPPTRISGIQWIQWYSLVCCWNLDGIPPVSSATWEDLRGLAMRF